MITYHPKINGDLKIFRDWLVSCEVKMACLKKNVVLLMDQCAAHDKYATLKQEGLLHLLPTTTGLHATNEAGYNILHETNTSDVCSTFLFQETETNASEKKTSEKGTYWMPCEVFPWQENPSYLP